MKTPKGTRDLLPRDTVLFQKIEQEAVAHFGRYGFREIRTPIFEETALFSRGIGESTDIVNKEMYTFQDKGGRSMTLRPELTASVCRAVIQHSMVGPGDVVRLMYVGPMFRYERPQAGRYRQFHQLGAEVFGTNDPLVDAETIEALMSYLQPYGLPNLSLALNSVGDHTDRPKYLDYLKHALAERSDKLCPDCRVRRVNNVLRVLDCKNRSCQDQLEGLAPIAEFWSKENRDHFEQVCRLLDRLGVSYAVKYRLVRGLDYYTKTAFELLSGDLGAQSAVMGGGRYDGLVKLLGGKDTPAFGWALGIDRLAAIIAQHAGISSVGPDLFFVFGERAWLEEALPLIRELRTKAIQVGYDTRVGSFKSQLKRANREGARFVAIVGEEERGEDSVSLKNMNTSEQVRIRKDRLSEKIKEENHA